MEGTRSGAKKASWLAATTAARMLRACFVAFCELCLSVHRFLWVYIHDLPFYATCTRKFFRFSFYRADFLCVQQRLKSLLHFQFQSFSPPIAPFAGLHERAVQLSRDVVQRGPIGHEEEGAPLRFGQL